MARLALPLQFRRERAALDVIRGHSLFTIGALAVETPDGWRVVIDTAKPAAVCRYLAQHMPGVTWEQSEQ